MGMILTRLLADGRKILSETTRGITTTQVLNRDGEVMLTRLKQVSRKQVPPKIKRVGFLQQEQQDTFITIKKATKGETESYSILDRAYRNGVRVGERHLSSDRPCFTGRGANYIKDIFANEGGQLVHKSRTQIKNGVRSYRNNVELGLKWEELHDRQGALWDEFMTLRSSYQKIRGKGNGSSFQERKQMRIKMNELRGQMAELQKRKHKISEQTTTYYYMDGLPEGYGHLDRGYLDLNF